MDEGIGFHRWQGEKRLPADVPPWWHELYADNCNAREKEVAKHRRGGWVWWVNNYTGFVWVDCYWCRPGKHHRNRPKAKKERLQYQGIFMSTPAAPARPQRAPYPHITRLPEQNEPV